MIGTVGLRFGGRFDDVSVYRRAMAVIVGLSLTFRIASFFLLPDIARQWPDAGTYRTAAAELLSGRVFGSPHIMPGYPLLIALTGPGYGQLAADIVLSVLSVWCVARIALCVSGDRFASLLAGGLWAIDPFPMFYAIVGLTETLFVALVLLTFLSYYRASYLAGAVFMTAAILTRPLLEPMAPFLIVAFSSVIQRSDWRLTGKRILLFLAVYLALMAPWWLHNELKYKQFVRLNLSSGWVLFAGNNPMNTEGGNMAGVDVDPKAFSNIADPIAQHRAMQDSALDFIRANPQRFIRLAGLKFRRLWRLWPYYKDFAQPFFIVISALTMAPLIALAIAGTILQWRLRWREMSPILLFIALTTAVHVITIASVRYRFPMEPFLAVLGAPALAWAVRRACALWRSRVPALTST